MTEFESLVRMFKPMREQALRYLGNGIIATTTNAESGLNAINLISALTELPVSRKSKVGDRVWDFDDKSSILARDIQGAKSRIDFGTYEAINATIEFELKMAMLCSLEMPGAVQTKYNAKAVKPHTVIDMFKSAIPFYNQMSARKRAAQGDDFFEKSHFSLSDFTEDDYIVEAKEFDRSYRGVTRKAFLILRSSFMLENVFDKPLSYVELDSLDWKKNSITNKKIRTKSKWLPNRIFEKCSREASFAVVDFLKTLQEDIIDTDTGSRLMLAGYNKAEQIKLTRKSYDIYVAIRLTSAGYTGEQVIPFLYEMDPEYWSPQRRAGLFKVKDAIVKLTDTKFDKEFYDYLSHINNSAIFITAQYTGMRPSELCGCLIADCLAKDDFGHDLLLSTVFKGRDIYGKLFEDKWIAIPAVLDAVKALRILNKFKQHPYLMTSMNTIQPSMQDQAKSLTGSGLTTQMTAFLTKILTPKELEGLSFSTYTLRHSLANQMFRAAVGLPFISYQLKHFGHLASRVEQRRHSTVTVDYGGIGSALVSGGGGSQGPSRLTAEREFIVNACDPDGGYAGDNADAHRSRLKAYFQGYLEAGYSKDEIFDRMAELDFAIINVGQGYCYGNATDVQDPSLPCIGSLRCNPNRCKNAVVTSANAPKWREVYVQNALALRKIESASSEAFADLRASEETALSVAQLKLAIAEAEGVLRSLGMEVSV